MVTIKEEIESAYGSDEAEVVEHVERVIVSFQLAR